MFRKKHSTHTHTHILLDCKLTCRRWWGYFAPPLRSWTTPFSGHHPWPSLTAHSWAPSSRGRRKRKEERRRQPCYRRTPPCPKTLLLLIRSWMLPHAIIRRQQLRSQRHTEHPCPGSIVTNIDLARSLSPSLPPALLYLIVTSLSAYLRRQINLQQQIYINPWLCTLFTSETLAVGITRHL